MPKPFQMPKELPIKEIKKQPLKEPFPIKKKIPIVSKLNWVYTLKKAGGIGIYNIDTKKSSFFPSTTTVATEFCSSIRVKELIYLFGGEKVGEYMLDQALEITVSFKDSKVYVKSLKKMSGARSNPSLISYDENLIFVIGGYVRNNESEDINERFPATKACEVYNIRSCKWGKLSPLNQPIAEGCLCILNDVLYCIGGCTYWPKSICNMSMQRININNYEKNVWSYMEILDPLHNWKPRKGMLSIPLNENEIYIFGGNDGKDLKEAFVFNVNTKKITKRADMPSTYYTIYRQVFHYSNNVIYVMDGSFSLLSFNSKELAWKIISSRSVFSSGESSSLNDLKTDLDELKAKLLLLALLEHVLE